MGMRPVLRLTCALSLFLAAACDNDPSSTTIPPSLVSQSSVADPSGPAVFGFTGGDQTYTVPSGVTSVVLQVSGAQGGGGNKWGGQTAGGAGGYVEATVPVKDGDVLTVRVGGMGANRAGGFNGGGRGGLATFLNGDSGGGGGGGATTVLLNGQAIIIAGGGGGGGGDGINELNTVAGEGGAGGGLTGGTGFPGSQYNYEGSNHSGTGGQGGSQTSPGTGADFGGAAGIGGTGGNAGNGYADNSGGRAGGGGGGGGGYFGGGGGGGAVNLGAAGAGGGGGSSWTASSLTNVISQSGINIGHGQVKVLVTGLVATFSWSGADQQYTVPADVHSINVMMYGAQGGAGNGWGQSYAGGRGGYVEATLDVTPGEALNLSVGGIGSIRWWWQGRSWRHSGFDWRRWWWRRWFVHPARYNSPRCGRRRWWRRFRRLHVGPGRWQWWCRRQSRVQWWRCIELLQSWI